MWIESVLPCIHVVIIVAYQARKSSKVLIVRQDKAVRHGRRLCLVYTMERI